MEQVFQTNLWATAASCRPNYSADSCWFGPTAALFFLFGAISFALTLEMQCGEELNLHHEQINLHHEQRLIWCSAYVGQQKGHLTRATPTTDAVAQLSAANNVPHPAPRLVSISHTAPESLARCAVKWKRPPARHLCHPAQPADWLIKVTCREVQSRLLVWSYLSFWMKSRNANPGLYTFFLFAHVL